MTPKSEYLLDLIFKKLKNYRAKEIYLDKQKLRKFIILLINGKRIEREIGGE
tara:strand:- start:294 stop:449 length:156 start_codon:yes stop_codon:yes gene_type:complete